jgi:phosphatidylglycerophosphate synthase
MANALTALRLLLVAPFAFFMTRRDTRSAMIVLAIWSVALITDFLDGAIARRSGTVSAFGGTFDHTTDFLFVTGGIFVGAHRGAFPWILPILIVAAFTQYFIDSYWIHRRAKLRGSKLGRYNGILYFVPPCADALIRLGVTFLKPLLTIFAWGLVVSTLVSMFERALFMRSAEHFSAGTPQK